MTTPTPPTGSSSDSSPKTIEEWLNLAQDYFNTRQGLLDRKTRLKASYVLNRINQELRTENVTDKCSICHKMVPVGVNYGMLENCNHVYCEPCLRDYHRYENNGCAICRQPYERMIFSHVFFVGDQKKAEFEADRCSCPVGITERINEEQPAVRPRSQLRLSLSEAPPRSPSLPLLTPEATPSTVPQSWIEADTILRIRDLQATGDHFPVGEMNWTWTCTGNLTADLVTFRRNLQRAIEQTGVIPRIIYISRDTPNPDLHLLGSIRLSNEVISIYVPLEDVSHFRPLIESL